MTRCTIHTKIVLTLRERKCYRRKLSESRCILGTGSEHVKDSAIPIIVTISGCKIFRNNCTNNRILNLCTQTEPPFWFYGILTLVECAFNTFFKNKKLMKPEGSSTTNVLGKPEISIISIMCMVVEDIDIMVSGWPHLQQTCYTESQVWGKGHWSCIWLCKYTNK